MGIDYSGMMIVGVHFDNLPEEIREQEDIYEWIDENGLDAANEWYDCGVDGLIIGKSMPDVLEKDLEGWFFELKEAFHIVRTKLKVEPTLIGTQDIY